MDRRDVLKLGVAATVSGGGCASLLSNPASVGTAELPEFLSALDTALGGISAGSFFDRFLPEQRSEALSAREER